MSVEPLYEHQKHGIATLEKWDDLAVGRRVGGCFALFDEMGAGKTRQVIEAASNLWERGELDVVLVIAPASVRTVWYDPKLGEIKKFGNRIPIKVTEYHSQLREWSQDEKEIQITKASLQWVVTNYDFIRKEDRLQPLLDWFETASKAGKKILLVLDESSAVKNWKAQQTKAAAKIREKCDRVILLNGTPITNSLEDVYSQARLMSPHILACRTFWQFRAQYAITEPRKFGANSFRAIVGWRNIEHLQRKLKPYVLRREKKDCLDLPPKLPPVSIEARLSVKTWEAYKSMRDDMILWFDENESASAMQAGVRIMRLAQITSGFVGGLAEEKECPCTDPAVCHECLGTNILREGLPPKDLGTEKMTALKSFLEERFEVGEKVLVWCRFRREVERIIEHYVGKVPLGVIWGGQKKQEREGALQLLDPRTAPVGPGLVVGTPASGSMGLNLTAAWTVVYLSNDYSLKTRLQSEDRVHRPGQEHPVSYFDVVATGPEGQQTVDHAVIEALRKKEEVAKFTVSAWLAILKRDRNEEDMPALQQEAVQGGI